MRLIRHEAKVVLKFLRKTKDGSSFLIHEMFHYDDVPSHLPDRVFKKECFENLETAGVPKVTKFHWDMPRFHGNME
jgi:hypothetical protein